MTSRSFYKFPRAERFPLPSDDFRVLIMAQSLTFVNNFSNVDVKIVHDEIIFFQFREFLFSPLKGHGKLEVVVVMLIVPLFVNAFMFWVQVSSM